MTAQALPGVTTGRTVTPRRVLQQAGRTHLLRQVAVTLDGTNSYDGGNTSYEKYIRGGALLARSSSSGLWAPLKRTKANGLGSSATALTVDNAVFFRAGDSVIVGNNAAQAIVSINYSTNVITLTSAITWKDNEPVTVAAFATARAILLDDEVSLWNADKSANVNKTAQAVILGYVDQDKVLGDLDAALQDYDSAIFLKDIVFDDYQIGIDSANAVNLLGGFRRCKYVAADLTLTAADNGTLFIATAAVNFTLPTLAEGLHFGFYQTADANMVLTAPGSNDSLVTDGDAAADTITYSTSSHKIGSFATVQAAPDATVWLTANPGGTTRTIA